MIERCIAAALGILILGAIGAFLMLVPILPLVAFVVVSMGLVLMFLLGIYAASSRRRRRDRQQVETASAN